MIYLQHTKHGHTYIIHERTCSVRYAHARYFFFFLSSYSTYRFPVLTFFFRTKSNFKVHDAGNNIKLCSKREQYGKIENIPGNR